MSVKDFMTEDLVTVTPKTKIFDAVDLMKKYDIHRLPVMEEEQLVGLITEGTIQEALPSKATSLSVHEVNYLLNKTVVSDVMIKDVKTISPDAELEDGIFLMRQNKINVLPVLDGTKLVGIITNNDIFDAFLKLTGYYEGGTRVQLKILEDKKGVLARVAKILADHDFSILTVIVDHQVNATILEIQLASKETEEIKQLLTDNGYEVLKAIITQP
ncbi:CBS and ACT domain-containing protein [Enterococcus raffinosus]|uniref:CBS and ACT domain-containing protein n=1 Tax=Enterococcus raffinosus TaxID=71452 RepID=A0AAW8TEN1_9ENTE|nr:CBS and ACT domain-containing protein [Enterococcus raffinosus]MDT2525200.1 CBS and ACT domain-containing protein [Enterococcus raffinosus]MDT2532083.1 CBS and ACT domain-containing protein [Enterococcus raffinosus]MDT2535801.1 CBS and ACT domain-containing protein [Enterococcus raffinosus]MDT2546275.1 CBS and ACT domain-containing protein [Enterococcus raffinosus]MDT2556236.1 CBS and ACT domain-containing protein [Enterococcus raffinosus]